jgi:hypothetical protein
MRVSDRRFTVGFADPRARLAAFQAEWTAERSRYVTEIRTAHREAREAAAFTRARLLAVAAALAHNLDTLESLVRPVLGDTLDRDGTAERRREGAPEPQLHSRGRLLYLFRDWVWGSSENAVVLEAFGGLLPEIPAGGTVLALGAGAMALPLAVARRTAARRLIGVDLDPVLCLAMDRLLGGATLSLYEVPREPRDLASVVRRHDLLVPLDERDPPCDVVLADAGEWVPDGRVDLLLTPFVLDVAGADARALLERWWAWLRPGGWWLHVGPLTFRSPHRAHAYTCEELFEGLERRGLLVRRECELEIPHLASPLAGRTQRFRVRLLAARVTGSV